MNKDDYKKINTEMQEYILPNYDIFYFHGWFSACSILEDSTRESDEFPIWTLKDTKYKDEKQFNKFYKKFVMMSDEIFFNTFQNNKLLRPLVNLDKTIVDFTVLDPTETVALVKWLWGFCDVIFYFDLVGNILDVEDEEINTRFFNALYNLSCIFLNLKDKLELSNDVTEDLNETTSNLLSTWEQETDNQEESIEDIIASEDISLALKDIVVAINDILYTILQVSENNS